MAEKFSPTKVDDGTLPTQARRFAPVRSRVAAVWICSLCGCARNTRSDETCRLCARHRGMRTPSSATPIGTSTRLPARLQRRRPGRLPAFADHDPLERSVERGCHEVSHLHAMPFKWDAKEAVDVHQARRAAPSALRDCVICYEITFEVALCCGQPLCSACTSSLRSANCPVCRRPLQHKSAARIAPDASCFASGSNDLIQLLEGAASVLISQPPSSPSPSESVGDRLLQLSRLQQRRGGSLAEYVDYVIGYAKALRDMGMGSEHHRAQHRLKAFMEEINPELSRLLEEVLAARNGGQSSRSGLDDALQVERLRRHQLLSNEQLTLVALMR